MQGSPDNGGPGCEGLYYCIESGGRWAGNIGEEQVTIQFSDDIRPEHLRRISPAGYQIEKNEVRWKLVDFKPKGKEFDIECVYFRPDIIRFLDSLRLERLKDSKDSHATVKLAKHLLLFGWWKSNGLFPLTLSALEADTILSRTQSSKERRAFLSNYKRQDDGTYKIVPGEIDDEDHPKILNAPANSGYRDNLSRSPYILEGESLLKGVLENHPNDAEAWNIFLFNFWRFSFAAVGRHFGYYYFTRPQAAAIEAARKNCPDDECINLWFKALHSGKVEEGPELEEAIKRPGYSEIEFKYNPYNSY